MYFSLLAIVALFIQASLADERYVLSDKPCNLKTDLPKTFDDIKASLAKPEQTKAEAKRLEMDLVYLRYCMDKQINAPEFTYALTEQLKPVKAARCKVIEEIANLIQPHNPWLLELKFGGKNETNSVVINGVVALLKYWPCLDLVDRCWVNP